jgi:hypothetical protein
LSKIDVKRKDEFNPRIGYIIRVFWVFLIAPLIGSLSWILIVSLLLLFREGLSPLNAGGFIALVLLTALYAYPTTFLIGIPSYLVYRRLQIHRLQSYIVGGFVSGLILGIYIFGTGDSSSYMPPLLASVVIWLTVAIAAAIETSFFWALVIRSRFSVG